MQHTHNLGLQFDFERVPYVPRDQREQFYFSHEGWADFIEPGLNTRPPVNLGDEPQLFSLDNDPVDRELTATKHRSAQDEYRHLYCYTYYRALANASLAEEIEALYEEGVPRAAKLEPLLNTLRACEEADRKRITYIRLLKKPGTDETDHLFAEVWGPASLSLAVGDEA